MFTNNKGSTTNGKGKGKGKGKNGFNQNINPNQYSNGSNGNYQNFNRNDGRNGNGNNGYQGNQQNGYNNNGNNPQGGGYNPAWASGNRNYQADDVFNFSSQDVPFYKEVLHYFFEPHLRQSLWAGTSDIIALPKEVIERLVTIIPLIPLGASDTDWEQFVTQLQNAHLNCAMTPSQLFAKHGIKDEDETMKDVSQANSLSPLFETLTTQAKATHDALTQLVNLQLATAKAANGTPSTEAPSPITTEPPSTIRPGNKRARANTPIKASNDLPAVVDESDEDLINDEDAPVVQRRQGKVTPDPLPPSATTRQAAARRALSADLPVARELFPAKSSGKKKK